MYHLGVMEVVIRVIAKAMQATMGTSATESMVAAGNIADLHIYEHLTVYTLICVSVKTFRLKPWLDLELHPQN